MANRPRKNTLRKEEKLARKRLDHRRGFLEAARVAGVADLFRKLPERVRRALDDTPMLAPVVLPDDPESAAHPAYERIATGLRKAVRDAVFKLEDGTYFPAWHALTYFAGLQGVFEGAAQRKDHPAMKEIGVRGKPIAAACADRYRADALNAVGTYLTVAAAHEASLDALYVSVGLRLDPTPRGGTRYAFPVTLTRPPVARFTIDGVTRPAYRCGQHVAAPADLRWTTWPAHLVGGAESDPPLDVWIQGHALQRIDERLKPLPPFAARLWTIAALRDARVASVDGPNVLIEFRFFDFRLGYLVARRVPTPADAHGPARQALVVTTFLFLTMAGSPEGRRLNKALRLHREEAAYQRLDELATFARSDALADPDLLAIFRQCGCGHLADLRDWFAKRADHLCGTEFAVAADLRRFLRLDESRQRKALEARLGLSLPGLTAGDRDALPEAA